MRRLKAALIATSALLTAGIIALPVLKTVAVNPPSPTYYNAYLNNWLGIGNLIGTLDPTGTVDAGIIIQNASAGGKILLPCGTFLIAEPITLSTVDFGGTSESCTILEVNFATGNAITVGAGNTYIHDLTIQPYSTLTRTGGAFIYTAQSFTRVERVTLSKSAIGIQIAGGGVSTIRDVSAIDTVAYTTYGSSTGFLLNGASESTTIDSPFCNYSVTTNIPNSCMEMTSSDAAVIINPNFIHGYSAALLVDPGAGAFVSSTQIIGGFLDAGTLAGLSLSATGTGDINRFTATGTWFGDTSAGSGIVFSSGGGVTAGFYCDNCYGVNNSSWFANIASSSWSNIVFIGGCSSLNGSGNFYGAANSEFIVISDFSHNTTACAGSPSPIGISLGSNTSKWYIYNNDFTGVTTPISGVSNLLSGTIINNAGYNPVGVTTPTIPVSGVTYFNGPTPEVLYIAGGTVSSIITQGIATGQTSGNFYLAPYQGITVTYSVAPTTFKAYVQ